MESEYDIHLCSAIEKPLLVKFIREHWRKDHIFTQSDELLDFQHLNRDGNYNFMIGVNRQTSEIDGILGFIPLSHFDPSLAANKDYWMAIWKVRDDIQTGSLKMLGLLLWEKAVYGAITHASIGISKIARKINKAQRQTVGTLFHYYIANPKITDFKIARFNEAAHTAPHYTDTIGGIELRFIELPNDLLIQHSYEPKKSLTFLKNRYERHPIYKYRFLGVFKNEILQCIFVTRTIEIQNHRCIRIVDIYGEIESIPSIYSTAQTILEQENAEYIDCMNYGIEPEEFMRLGFKKLDPNQDTVIIPNYFEPFLQKNISIDFAYKAPKGSKYIIFKGDSDQDRPNVL